MEKTETSLSSVWEGRLRELFRKGMVLATTSCESISDTQFLADLLHHRKLERK